MARTVGSSGPKTLEAIRKAGLMLIQRHGYEAMSMRDLAGEVGIRQGSLYNHVRTKQELLLGLVETHMHELLAALDDALAGISAPRERLTAFTRFHVGYHLTRAAEVFISYSELRSLEPENYRKIVRLRHRYENALIVILEDGAEAGAFDVADCKVAAFAILAMLSGAPAWFRPKGRLGNDEIIAIYADMVLRSVAAGRAQPDRPRTIRTAQSRIRPRSHV